MKRKQNFNLPSDVVRMVFLLSATIAPASVFATAGGTDDAYVMVYHKDCDHSLHMAVSDDGLAWRAVRFADAPVVRGRDIAEQKGIRDPHIFRAPDGTYLVAATDLHLFAQKEKLRETEWERAAADYGWGNNRGLVLLKSRDLIDWEPHNLDFTALTGRTFALDKNGAEYPWGETGCVWAPEMVWDAAANRVFLHFTVRFGNGPTRIYGVHLDESMTALAETPFPFYVPPTGRDHQPMYPVIDTSLVQDDEGVWHLFYVSHQFTATVRHATAKSLFGPYKEDLAFSDGEERGHEAPNCWRRGADGPWVLMYDRYSMTPHNFGFLETDDFSAFRPLGYFGKGVMTRHGFSEQKHGAVVRAPAADVRRLEAHYAAERPDGTNPIVKTVFTPDPAPVVDGDTLYLFTGHDEPDAERYKMRDWQVFKTKDMVHWESLGAVMDTKTFRWAVQGDRAWASQAVQRGRKWYWYVAVACARPRADAIGVAVADSPEGPWRDALGVPLVTGKGYIDPTVFIDDDSQAWLFWGNCAGDPGCWYAPLKENMVELAGAVRPVPGLMDEAAFGKPLKKAAGAGAKKPLDTNFEEAPWIYKVGDTYYLEYAAGGVPEHWAYSWAKSIHGPWHYGGRIMDEAEGTGTIHGGSVFFKGAWYMVYHNATLPGGADCRRSACIERYARNADGSIPFIPATREGCARILQPQPSGKDADK